MRLKENIYVVDIKLSGDQLVSLEEATKKIQIKGERLFREDHEHD